MSKQQTVTVGLPFAPSLTLLFIGLRLTEHIHWSWWWVLSPLWITFALVLVTAAVLVALE